MIIKLSKWAKQNGYTYRGAYNKFHNNGIKGAFISDSGRIMVDISSNITKPTKVVTYSRVSSHKQKNDLLRQSKRLSDFCVSNGYIIHHEFKEIASGLNDNRPILNKILSDDSITTIIVENKDRLTRFGFNYLKNFTNKEIIVVNLHHEDKDDLMQDLISVITSMVSRYYGQRRSKNIKEKILKELDNDKD